MAIISMAIKILTMTGAKLLLAEPSCLGTAGIDVETLTVVGWDIPCASVLATSDVGA